MSIKTLVRSTTLGVILGAGGSVCVQTYLDGAATFGQTERQQQEAPVSRDKLRHAIALSEAFKGITKAVAPSVVNIRSTQHLQTTSRGQDGTGRRQQIPSPEDLFRRFFGDENLPPDLREFPGSPQPRERIGEGSGVIIREDGYILTNNHVVAQADEIIVTLSDDREYTAKVLGTDPDTDLAVVHVEASGLTAAKLGNSDTLEPGEWVLAMGSPFGLQHTVTAGIVSAKGRQVGIIRDERGYSGYEDFIQTDAAINPGNSGGPLVNIYGEVVGINTAISSRTGTNVGVGFAIPSKIAQFVMTSIIDKGRVERGWLGVGIQPLTRELAESYGLSTTEGAVVNEVRKGSPAENAGLKVDDVIVKINDTDIATPTELMNMVAASKPGASVKIEAIRSGKHMTFDVKLAERNPEAVARAGEAPRVDSSRNLGLSVRTLTREDASQLDAADLQGVLVTEVDPDSPAGRVGIAPGDIITKIGEETIASVEDFNQAMSKQNIDKGVRLHVFRDGVPRVIVVKSSRR